MRWTQYYIPTLKEAPGDAEVISHKLLIRSGMIRKLTSGIYTWLPLGIRSLDKAINIVREEMNKIGALEVLMPMVQPADLWLESGRWEEYGKELLRFKDRHDRDYCLGPTHEEVMTDLLRGEVQSYRQLPVTLYQIQTKFRDEIRPRFGLMRGREFLMKDAYSFDRDNDGAEISYKAMFEAYTCIFTRMGLQFKAVEADSGSIGGNFSHEFMVLADTGEDTIVTCQQCDWSSNIERAAIVEPPSIALSELKIKEIATPDKYTIEDVSVFLNVSAQNCIKTLLYVIDGQSVAVLVRGDREVNILKVQRFFGANHVEMASVEQVKKWTGAPVGFAGPIGLDVEHIIADHELIASNDWITGANKPDKHLLHVDLCRDVPNITFFDIRMIVSTDSCPCCNGNIHFIKGIEVGHVFKLGTKYSHAMKAYFIDEHGKEQSMVMGCYGIGISRIVAACIEQNNDDKGIIFPPSLAPFEIEVINLDPKEENVAHKVEELYQFFIAQNIDVLIDDREERPGVKFNDADLIGIPIQICIGKKSLTYGVVEVKNRKTGLRSELGLECFYSEFTTWYDEYRVHS